MYGEGGAEEVVGEAIAEGREDVFVVSKVYPHNATRSAAIKARLASNDLLWCSRGMRDPKNQLRGAI